MHLYIHVRGDSVGSGRQQLSFACFELTGLGLISSVPISSCSPRPHPRLLSARDRLSALGSRLCRGSGAGGRGQLWGGGRRPGAAPSRVAGAAGGRRVGGAPAVRCAVRVCARKKYEKADLSYRFYLSDSGSLYRFRFVSDRWKRIAGI
jgi:hypothetical protein